MADLESLKIALIPLAKLISQLDLSDSKQATASLNEHAAPTGLSQLEGLLRKGHSEGWLTPKRAAPTITFGRVAKSSEETFNNSIDVVDIAGEGAEHTHPNGEVSLCLTLDGHPKFDGHGAGWVVLEPDSHHTPTVTNGRMLIVYFQPGGSVKWGPRAN
jgi:hypothetical protein